MSTDSSFPTVEEYEIESYENADGFLTNEQEQQLLLDEEALRETLEEQARVDAQNVRRQQELDEFFRKEQAEDEYFRLQFGKYPDYDSTSGEYPD